MLNASSVCYSLNFKDILITDFNKLNERQAKKELVSNAYSSEFFYTLIKELSKEYLKKNLKLPQLSNNILALIN